MRRFLSFLFAVMLLFSFCACQGNFGKMNLQEPIAISEDGIVKQRTIEQIRDENAIASFTGESNGFKYEWMIFGSDIQQAKEINLLTAIREADNGEVEVALSQDSAFGFSALLSVHLNSAWEAQSATAYQDNKAAASVSVTGSKTTILNISTDGSLREFVIRPDALPKETITEEISESPAKTEKTEEPKTELPASAAGGDDYLSGTKQTDDTVYKESRDQYTVVSGNTQSASSDAYLSDSKESDDKVYSGGKDKYLTDPIPAGKPKPVEPEDQEVHKGTSYTCTFSIECSTILNNMDQLDPDKLEMVPSNGVILKTTKVTFYEGESVYDVLQRVCKDKNIHMEASWTPIYNSAYVEGIHNLYEFDCGNLSGWMYRVNGWYPNYGCSRYQLKQGDTVEWRYTCDLGHDVGRTGSW